MTSARRPAALLLSLLALACTLTSPAAAVDPVPNSAAASARLKYLPADYWAVIECNVAPVMAMMNTPQAEQNPQFAQFKQYMQLVKMMTGVDPEKDVAWVTIFVTGTPGAGAAPLFVVQGTFDNAVVQERLGTMAGSGVTESDHNGAKVFATPGADLSFPEASTMLAGPPAVVRAALDQLAAGEQELPAALKNVLDRTPADSIVWSAVQPRVLLDAHDSDVKSAHAELHGELSKLDCLSTWFSLAGDGLLINTLGYVADSGGAAELHKYLSDRKQALLHEEGSNVVFTSLLVFSDLGTSDEYVEGSLRLTAAAMQELWNTKVIVRP